MGTMSKAAAALRAEMEAELLKEAEQLGPDGFDQDPVVKRFLGRGIGRSTIYRWAAEIMKSGKPGQHAVRKVKAAVAEHKARPPRPAAEVAAEIVERLPARVSVADVTGAGTIPIIERLQECIRAAQEVMRHARHDDGKVRNAKLLVSASEHLRRSLETSVRLFEAMRQIDQVDRLHTLIMEEIERESPACAERIVTRLGQLVSEWGG